MDNVHLNFDTKVIEYSPSDNYVAIFTISIPNGLLCKNTVQKNMYIHITQQICYDQLCFIYLWYYSTFLTLLISLYFYEIPHCMISNEPLKLKCSVMSENVRRQWLNNTFYMMILCVAITKPIHSTFLKNK